MRNTSHQKLNRRKRRIARNLVRRKRRIARRLARRRGGHSNGRPVLSARNIHYEVADRALGMGCGGIGVIHQLADQTGLVDAIDDKVKVREADLNLAAFMRAHVKGRLCGGAATVILELP